MKEVIHSIFSYFGIVVTFYLLWWIVCPEVEFNSYFSILISFLSFFIENWLNSDK